MESHPRFALAARILTGVSACATLFCWWRGYLLYFGDAAAHLSIARRIVDSRTPGLDQIGTVWLPLPHLLMLPFVWVDALWQSGLAGALMSGPAYVLGGLLLYRALLICTPNRNAALLGLAVVALNPNLLYLQSLPMTESLFFASSSGLLYALLRFCSQPNGRWALWAAVAANAASLTRYEGWFLTGVAALCMLWPLCFKRLKYVLLFGLLASAGPLSWLAHNWWYYGDALEFYHGQYSAKAIYQRALDSGGFQAPGDGDWLVAARYFSEACRFVAGWWLCILGLGGALAAMWQGGRTAAILLGSSPFFYIWSLHSSGTPIFVPTLWPHSYYNTRYALSVLPLLALGVAMLLHQLRNRPRAVHVLASVLAVALIVPWTSAPICWRESMHNSAARRVWTSELASLMRREYAAGTTIFTASGDLMAAYTEAGIPFRELIFDGNNPQYLATLRFPREYLTAQWVVAQEGDEVDKMAKRRRLFLFRRIAAAGAAPILIYSGR